MDIGSKILLLIALFECVQCTNETVGESRVLSRRKRYLLFPEGSSFQLDTREYVNQKVAKSIGGATVIMPRQEKTFRAISLLCLTLTLVKGKVVDVRHASVFCVQTNALFLTDIFLYGQTAAFAWMIPTDPAIFHMFKGEKVAQRRGDELSKNIYYLDKDGQVIAKVPNIRPHIHPVFSKRSIDNKVTYRDKLKKLKIDRGNMHEKQLKKNYLKKHHMDKRSIEFHRSSRMSLLEKLETFFSALGQDGRQCVLYRLCKAGQGYRQQGTFLQEVLRVIFTLPKGPEDEEYDKAHATTKDCDDLYTCDDFSDSVQL